MCSKKFITFLFLSSITLLSVCNHAFADDVSDPIAVSHQVHELLKINSERLDRDTVANIFSLINKNRHQYSHDIVAKSLLLSARVASNQGDMNKTLLYSEQGLAINSLDKTINFSLLLKIAEVYVVKKEYQKLLELTEVLVKDTSLSSNVKYNLLALSYHSVAFSMIGKHQQALEDLKKVEQNINNGDLSDRIQLLTIFALAYHHLTDYQTALTIQLKILKLRFELDQKGNIEQTYLNLGYAFFYLQRYDDAYNAFWESKEAAQRKLSPINVAHANKALGLVLLKQTQAKEALSHLKSAVNVFSLYAMPADHLESLVALAKAMLEVHQTENAYSVLSEVLNLLKGKDVSAEYSGFNRMVADMYYAQGKYHLAYQWRIKDSDLLLEKLQSNKAAFNLLKNFYHPNENSPALEEPIQQSKRLAVKLAEDSEKSSSFTTKYKKQRVIIISLSIAIFFIFIVLLGLLLKLRVKAINRAYEQIEKPSYIINTPIQTKSFYQLSFKKSRQYQYPLCVAYLVIDNWQELVFRVNRKIITEVIKDIASTINLHIGEFDYAGLLNDGEYLLLFEHQNNEEAKEKVTKLVQAINARSFANLGNVSVTIKYSLDTPDFKDIDPYLFLARIAESVKMPTAKHPKVS